LAEKQLGDPLRALGAVGRWLAEDATSEHAAEELERLARQLGRWEEASARLADVIAAAGAPDVQRELSLRRGRIVLDALQDAAGAEAPYRRALELDKQNAAALAALDRIYRAVGDATQLAEILWRRAEVEYDHDQKRQHYAQVAQLREDYLHDN